jgi:hypothetical protein
MLESRESQTVLDDERSNEIGEEGGASGLVFFGMQVELALSLVPSQDDVLKDNKRCYDNILSECGISDPLQIYSGWLDEHDHGMQFWPPIVLTDITQFLLAHGDVALANDMLKDYKVSKAYEYVSSGWLQEGYFLKTKSNNDNLCILRTVFSPSQTLDDDPPLHNE